MIGFLLPALLTLLIPAAWWIFRHRGPSRSSDVLRVLIVVLLVTALARPYVNLSDPGRHVILLVDRSKSMPDEAEQQALDTVRLIEESRADGDRLGVISFGAVPEIESLPNQDRRLEALTKRGDPEATDLAAAIEAGLQQIPEGSQGSLLLLSDGLGNGRDPLGEARRAQARGLRIDILPQSRPQGSDLAVERFELPPEVSVGEPFQFNVWFRADEAQEREVVLLRDGRILSRGVRTIERGDTRLVFRDVLPRGGIASYEVHAAPLAGAAPDRFPENDRGIGAVRVSGAPAVLVLNEDGQPDSLSSLLTAAGIPTRVAAPEQVSLTRVGLSAYRAVVLENVAAQRIGFDGMKALADLVSERGGGLFMTGGRASFGIGGYHLSPLDALLPVSMEMREEHRQLGLAMALVLDRSGSMSVEVGGGRTKMDLANAGSAAAIEMLSNIDSVTVFAVDSAPHEVVPLEAVDNPEPIIARVRRIRSEGGGIFTYVGLLAAGRALEEAPQENRHIVLFADAADAEQQEGVPELLDRFAELGITVSVIALGTEDDVHADFLFETAERGGGDIYFTTEPEELPRLFAQDTLTVARSTFIEAPTATRGFGDLFAIGNFGLDASGQVIPFPTIDAYNLSYLRPGAILGARTEDEYAAPFLAFHHHGAGRTAALTGQVGGTFGQSLLAWAELPAMLVTTTRWLLGQAAPDAYFADMRREGKQAVVRLEIDPDADADTSKLELHLTRGDGTRVVTPLEPVSEFVFEKRVSLGGEGVALGSVHLADGRVLQLPPVALPYSPEYAPLPGSRAEDPGRRTLEELAAITGGSELSSLERAFDGPREARRWRDISWELMLLGLGLFLFEILTRRLDLFSAPWVRALLRMLGRPAKLVAALRRPDPGPVAAAPAPVAAAPTQAPEVRTAPEPQPKREHGPGSLEEAMRRARERAGRRLDR
ncbi:MAG: VWA domain-containing protein [Planctomycetota bacterium]|nr:VWA domain-containing protein [Planctomycetota bacterium]